MLQVFRPVASSSSPLTVEGLTRDVGLKNIHSHNDYWRTRPLVDALSVGAVSVEADVWKFDADYVVTTTASTGGETKEFKADEVYVGHNQIFLESNHTLDSLYLDTLHDLLESTNVKFSDGALLEDFDSKFSIWYNSPELPLYLWFDIKTDAEKTYAALQKLLERFVAQDYLAWFDATTNTTREGPVYVTITGNVPWDTIAAQEQRYTFVDVPLANFTRETDEARLQQWAQLGVVASASMLQLVGKDNYAKIQRGDIDDHDDIRANLTATFDKAHQYGLKTRIWGDVTWPNHVSDSHLRSLWAYGCDLLNVDDLERAANLF